MSLWGDWTDHWKSQLKRHKKAYEAGALVLTTLLAGPAITAAYLAVKQGNATQKQIDAVRAAKKALAQTPVPTEASVRQSLGVPTIGATGRLAFTPGMTGYVPLVLAFLIVAYILFKD